MTESDSGESESLTRCRENGTHRWRTLIDDTFFDGVMIIRQCIDCGKVAHMQGPWEYIPTYGEGMDRVDIEKRVIQGHLERILKEITKLKCDLEKNTIYFGGLENRLYWAIRGVDPEKSYCDKHGRKITRLYTDYICPDCMQENQDKYDHTNMYEENLWFDPDDKITIKLHKIRFIHE